LPQGDPKQPIARPQMGASGSFHGHQLLPQRQVLQNQFSLSAESQRQRTTDDNQQLQHVSILAGVGAKINSGEFWRGSGHPIDYADPELGDDPESGVTAGSREAAYCARHERSHRAGRDCCPRSVHRAACLGP
jgi:hypothetical protein